MIAFKHRRRAILLSILLVLGAAVWAARAAWLPWFALWLDAGEKPRRADLVMILPGDAQSRPFVAAALVKTGYAPRAVVAETRSSAASSEGSAETNAMVFIRVMEARGVSPELVAVIPGASASTFDDARALARHLEERPARAVAVVTSDYHTRRARWVFRRVLGNAVPDLFFVSAPTDHYDPREWWRSHGSIVIVLTEYLKLGFYIMRYGHGAAWISIAAVAAAGALMARRARARRRETGPADAA